MIDCVFVLLQNAGAIIGKGGSNIKRLRVDVSVLLSVGHMICLCGALCGRHVCVVVVWRCNSS